MSPPTSPGGHRLVIAIALAVGAAIAAGLLLPGPVQRLAFLGELFLNALKMVIVPLVMTSIMSGVSSLGDVRRLGRIGAATFAYYLTTTLIAVVTGLVLVNLIQPGVGSDIGGAVVPEKVAGKTFSIVDVIVGLVSPNLFASMAETDVLPLIVFSLVLGGVLTTIGEPGRRVLDVVEGLNLACLKIVDLIMWGAPVGIFAMVGARLGAAVEGGTFLVELGRLGGYSLTVVLGLAIHGLVTLPLLLWLFTRRSPLTYMRNLAPVYLTAFSTASSNATLPLTLEHTEHTNRVSREATSFVIPLGATMNMDGTALYEAVAAVFIAQAFGVPLTFEAQVLVVITATLASIGAAGIPEAGLVTMILVLTTVGLPLEGLGTILAVDWMLDRFRTTVNVWGDAVGAAVVDARIFGRYGDPPEPAQK